MDLPNGGNPDGEIHDIKERLSVQGLFSIHPIHAIIEKKKKHNENEPKIEAGLGALDIYVSYNRMYAICKLLYKVLMFCF